MTPSTAKTGTDVRPRVAVLSVYADTVDRETDRSLEEMIFEATSAALRSAGVDRSALDGVVLSGNDQTDGRVISCMTSAGPAGGVDLDVTMIASSGEHALVYGYLRLLAGQGDNVLVVGWSKPSESVYPEHAELVGAEPYVLRAVGVNNTLAAALAASRHTHDAGPPAEEVVSWPLTRADLPATGDAVYAAVLGVAGTFPPGSELCWVRGAGWATDHYELGARRERGALEQALEHLASSGAPDPARWASAEIAAPSVPAVREAVGALGLAEDTPVNPSGPLSAVPAPAHVAGLGRLLAAARGASGAGGRGALTGGVGLHGFAGQGATVMVFGEEDK
ncbi:hypothetical protein [Streptomyces sp. NPDC005438]|uniref:hypothetical protein n=1 Tax=Streptomyces sp. NPDC005438 TaxID=3156880 RepID=UPI00339ED44F